MELLPTAQKVAKSIREYALSIVRYDPEDALLVAKGYGSFLWANHVGILSDVEFENKISENFTYLLNGRKCSGEFDTLHLMTNAHTSGGHTGVVIRLLAHSVGDGLAVIDDLPQLVINRLPDNLTKFSMIRKSSGVGTISEIIKIGCNYKTLILHIHPDDIYSSIAAILLNKLGVNVCLYNHADHAFSFGYSAAQKVFEISKYGWMKGLDRGIGGKQSFVGVPIDLCKVSEPNNSKRLNSIFMAGSADKFIPWNDYSVPKFINRIFKEKVYGDNLAITICGPNGNEKFWKELDKNVKNKVFFTGRVVYKEYLERLSNSDCYIDSFPMANGTSFAESVMFGIPSFGLSLYSGYSCSDILRSPSLDDLVEVIGNYSSIMSDFYHSVLDVREQLILEQSPEICAARLRSSIVDDLQIPLLDSLSSMICIENFIESHWESKAKITIPLSMLLKIKINHKLEMIKILFGCYPFASTNLTSVLEKLAMKK